MEELIQTVARRAGITLEQSALAVSAMLRILSHRLPSPIVGQIRAILDDEEEEAPAGRPDPAPPLPRP